jgi:hypothetical protein
MDESTSKACGKCGEVKRLGEFYKSKRRADGYRWDCKECAKGQRRGYAKANRDRESSYTRHYRARDPEKHAAYMKAWRADNAELVKATSERWNDENREHLAEMKRQWYEANRDRILERIRTDEAVREARRDAARQSRERTRDARAERQRRRRVDKLGLRVEDVDIEALWTGRCGLCEGELDPGLRHPDPLSKSLDHIIPLALGGTHEASNLQWAHLVCNVRKGARSIA